MPVIIGRRELIAAVAGAAVWPLTVARTARGDACSRIPQRRVVV
jgi:hypothetical protein